MECQRDGTAIPSLATEYLQQADRLSGPEHQQAVRTIKDTLGSMFQGKNSRVLYEIHRETLTSRIQLVQAQHVFSPISYGILPS